LLASLLPFEISNKKKSEVFPLDGFGSIVLQREILLNKILASSHENNAIYIRAPRGCGKTSLLHLIGAKLLSQGCKVFYVKSAANFDVNTESQMKSLSDSCEVWRNNIFVN
jgi:predicted AAA+ superfamily ATPase